MTIFLTVMAAVLAVGSAAVVYGTFAKNRWGINLADVYCPRCGAQLPKVRKPQSVRQEMWGGSTCPNCDAEVDKWGRELLQEQNPAEASLLGRFKGRSAAFWALILGLILLGIWFDYDSPRAIIDQAIVVTVVLLLYRKFQRSRSPHQ